MDELYKQQFQLERDLENVKKQIHVMRMNEVTDEFKDRLKEFQASLADLKNQHKEASDRVQVHRQEYEKVVSNDMQLCQSINYQISTLQKEFEPYCSHIHLDGSNAIGNRCCTYCGGYE